MLVAEVSSSSSETQTEELISDSYKDSIVSKPKTSGSNPSNSIPGVDLVSDSSKGSKSSM